MAVMVADGDLGMAAPDFRLKDPGGSEVGLQDVRGENGTLVMFICNHCPYVKAIAGRIARDAKDLKAKGIGVVAIMPNDYASFPDDAPDRMAVFADSHGFDFPYLVDETQGVAKAYGAVCTPDFFGFDKDLKLTYRGRLDESRAQPAAPDAKRDLYDAMVQVADTGAAPAEQHASMGCSIKWRT
ncbi:MAG: thioredoxin family protein [Pseudomonadota bacterium]